MNEPQLRFRIKFNEDSGNYELVFPNGYVRQANATEHQLIKKHEQLREELRNYRNEAK